MKLIDMTYTQTEAKEEMEETKASIYPWGLRLYLDDDVLEKLKMSRDDFEVGEEMSLDAVVRVVGVSEREYEDQDPVICVDLQITKMGLGEEEKEDEASSLGSRMYGDK